MQSDTAVAVGRPRKERVGKFLRQHLQGIASALGWPQDLDWDGWEALISQQTLMGGCIIELDDGLVALVQVAGGARQGTVIVIEPALDIEMGFDAVHVILPLLTRDSLMVSLKPSADG